MRTLKVTVMVGVALLAWGGACAGAAGGARTLSYLDVSRQDVPPINDFTFNRMPRPGDQFAIEDNLYKWAGAKRGGLVGRVEGIGTFQVVAETGARVLFFAQAYLPGGSIDVEGYGRIDFRGPSRFTFPITGGTGAYANARGYVTVRDLGNGESNNSSVTVHLMS